MKKLFLMLTATIVLAGCTDETTLIAVAKITLTPAEASIRPGTTTLLTANAYPDGADETVVWHSSNPEIAEVNAMGMVTAKTKGEVTITASTSYAEASCQLRVGADVYVAGIHDKKSALWKNGKLIWTGNENGVAGEMSVIDEKVYLPMEEWGEKTSAVLYTDGVALRLSENYSGAYGVAKSGADIYVCGFEATPAETTGNYLPVLWKNGELHQLSGYGFANDIAVDNNNIYITGSVAVDASSRNYKACVWKNGELSFLSENTSSTIGIEVREGKVYIAGDMTDTETFTTYGCYWVDGNMVRLSESDYAKVRGLFVTESGDVLIPGATTINDESGYWTAAILWKNGKRTILESNGSNANALDAFESDGTLYIAGMMHESRSVAALKAVLWVDGKLTELETEPMKQSEAHEVYIVE